MPNIFVTKDYSQFNFFHDRNRTPHPKLLIESIKQKDMLKEHPIIVDTNMFVIDGQNRLKAAEFLKLPIYYIISDTLGVQDIGLCQTQMPWMIDDFLKFYRANDPDYEFVHRMKVEHKLITHVIIECCCHDSNICTTFKKGLFKIKKDKKKLENDFKKLSELTQTISKYLKLSPSKDKSRLQSKYIRALWGIIQMEGYHHKRMLERLDARIDDVVESFKLRETSTIKEWLIKHVYDFRLNEKNKLIKYA